MRRSVVLVSVLGVALAMLGGGSALAAPPTITVAPSDHAAPFRVAVPHLLDDGTGRFLVRPATLSFGVSGQFVVGKLPHRSSHGIRWWRWDASARGRATVWIDVSAPASLGHYIGCPGTVTASRLRGGRYTRLAVSWRRGGASKTERFTLKRWADGSRWGWF